MKDKLASRIRMGDEQAFELLFRTYYTRLCGFANKYLNNPEDAKDTVQSVFTKIWESREEIDPSMPLKAYLFKITGNSCINRLRHKKVESKYDEIYRVVYVENKGVSPLESLIANDLSTCLASALKKIPKKCRIIFDLSRVEGLKYSEIAENQKISVKTVEAQMSKALGILRFELKDFLKCLFIFVIQSHLYA